MTQVNFQELHDAMQSLIMAAVRVLEIISGDFPEVRDKIADFIAEGEYGGDPILALFDSTERATEILRKIERI